MDLIKTREKYRLNECTRTNKNQTQSDLYQVCGKIKVHI
jgi:hypothetical protein